MVDYVVVPAGMAFDPNTWDYTLLLPIWGWIIIFLLGVGFVVLVAMVYVWIIMRPVSGYGAVGDSTALSKGSPTQVFSIWKNRSFVIECVWYYGNMLAYGNPLTKMQMWFHNSEKATGVSAEKPVMITRDGFDGTVDFIAEMAVCEIPPLFNSQWGFELVPRTDINGRVVIGEDGTPELKEVERKDDNGIQYMLSTFSDIRTRMSLLEKLYPDGVPIPIYKPYDLSEIYRYTPQNQDSLKFGADIVEEAKEWSRDDERNTPGLFDRFGLLIICGICGIASVGMLWYILPIR